MNNTCKMNNEEHSSTVEEHRRRSTRISNLRNLQREKMLKDSRRREFEESIGIFMPEGNGKRRNTKSKVNKLLEHTDMDLAQISANNSNKLEERKSRRVSKKRSIDEDALPPKKKRKMNNSRKKSRKQNMGALIKDTPFFIISEGIELNKMTKVVGSKIGSMMKLPKASKWLSHEFFYSENDRSLFRVESFDEHCRRTFPRKAIKALTRKQWGEMKQLLGKPRRLSENFFQQERKILNRNRQRLRELQRNEIVQHRTYSRLPEMARAFLPIGCPVTARVHEPLNGLFVGTVYEVDTIRCMYIVEFEELGTLCIPDINVVSNIRGSPFNVKAALENANFTEELPDDTDSEDESKEDEERKLQIGTYLMGIEHLLLKVMNGYPFQLLRAIFTYAKSLKRKSNILSQFKSLNELCEFLLPYNKHGLGYATAETYGRFLHMLASINKDLTEEQLAATEICEKPEAVLTFTGIRCDEQFSEHVSEWKPRVSLKESTETALDMIKIWIELKKLESTSRNIEECMDLLNEVVKVTENLHFSQSTIFRRRVKMYMKYIQYKIGGNSCVKPWRWWGDEHVWI